MTASPHTRFAGQRAGGSFQWAPCAAPRLLAFSVLLAVAIGLTPAHAQAEKAPTPNTTEAATPSAAASAPANSQLDDRLMYQLLVAEFALAQGDAGTAYQWMLEAARRTGDEGLFRRSTDIALQARAGDQALQATKAWRQSHPTSREALRTELQILLALKRPDALAEPLRALLSLTPSAERSGLIGILPRFLQRAGEPARVAGLVEEAVRPYLKQPDTAVASRVALARAWLDANDGERSWALVQEADNAAVAQSHMNQSLALNPGPALLALEMMAQQPKAEALVQNYLAHPSAAAGVRLAYVRQLARGQRFAEAVAQLQTLTRAQPDMAQPYLTLGALHLELKQADEAEAALNRYVALATKASGSPVAPLPEGNPGLAEADDDQPDRGWVQAWLMLSQVAEMRGDFKGAEDLLSRIQDPDSLMEVQTRRANILARQGKIEQARDTIRNLPERRPADAKAKLLAEVSVLREAQRWGDAYTVLGETLRRFGDDANLMYEQAMVAEKANRLDDMEALLRQVIALKPDYAHAYNALGYSLAERNLRLPEALGLIEKALQISPGDPFITDSLGWVHFRMGNTEQALRHLREAWRARPDVEIGTHLGEVLWAAGQKEEALRIWREARGRDAKNVVLKEALTRLQVQL